MGKGSSVEWNMGKGVWSGMWVRECGVGCG